MRRLRITLPTEVADLLKAKVRTGEYASESAVILDGLRALLARDRTIDHWLHRRVDRAFDTLQADPSPALTVDQVRRRLAEEQGNPARRSVDRNAA